MAAYAALVSIMHIIDQLEHHPSPPISLDNQQVESLTEIVTLLQKFLEGYKSPVADSEEVDLLEMRIADAAYAAEDVIESNIVDRLQSQRNNKMGFFNCFRSQKESKSEGKRITSVDLYEGMKRVIEDMDLIKKQVTEIVAEKAVVKDELQRQVSLSASLSPNSTSTSASITRINNTMVGFDDLCLEIMDKLTDGQPNRQVIPIVGMGGIGKTTIAKHIFAQQIIKNNFDVCVWTTISQKYDIRENLCELLSHANKEKIERLSQMREDEVGLILYKYLSHRRFFIVLDDMWNIEAWENMQHYFPDNSNSSRIMVTTRLSNLGSQLDNDYGIQMKFLDEESSWNMFSKIVFKGGGIPPEIEKVGRKIVKSCRGLPLSIVVVGGLLEKLEYTKEVWKSIRQNLNTAVNSENDEHCLKILKMSYNHLPVHLKPCFLYMGVFGEDRVIQVSTVVKLWVSEGFLKPVSRKRLETIAKEYMKELVDRNLILAHKLGSSGSVKFCKIHDLLRDLCLRESHKERFYHVVGHHSPQSACSNRCIVILSDSSKKKVLNAIESTPYARSYISESERVGLSPSLRLLRTLKVCNTYHYKTHKFSLKMFELVNLRNLDSGAHEYRYSKIPSSISMLWNLQTLIVNHLGNDVSACIEIWKMPQLRHIQVFGLRLPNPSKDNFVMMENLQTLTQVTGLKCDDEVVRRIPNIKKLGLFYFKDKVAGSINDDYYCLRNVENLHNLKSLDCVCYGDTNYLIKLSFPHSLKRLNLQMMMNEDLEDMLVKIGSLPLLQKLMIYGGSLKNGTWEVVEGQFPKLRSLYFYCNFSNWTTENSPFPCLEHLHLHYLTNLNEIPTEIGDISTLQSVTLEWCGASLVKSMKKIVEEQEELQGEELSFKVQVLLHEENEELQNLANPNFQFTIR